MMGCIHMYVKIFVYSSWVYMYIKIYIYIYIHVDHNVKEYTVETLQIVVKQLPIHWLYFVDRGCFCRVLAFKPSRHNGHRNSWQS